MLAMEAGGVIEALAAGPAFPTLLVSFPDQQSKSKADADNCPGM